MSHIRIFSLFNAAEIIGGRGEKSGDRIGVMNGVKTISLLGIIVTHVASIVSTPQLPQFTLKPKMEPFLSPFTLLMYG